MTMKRCRLCVLPESFPGIEFTAEGVCSLCEQAKERKELIPSLEKLKAKLEALLDEAKARREKYDALVAYSGGKDSTFLLHLLKERYGLSLLAFTFDNGFLSDHVYLNMRTVLDRLGVDHVLFRPRQDLMNKIFFESATREIYPAHLLKFGSSICISCIRMVTNLSLKVAIEKHIPLVMLGNSPGQLIRSENETLYQDNRIPYALRRKLFEPLAACVGDEVYYYLMLNREEYKVKPFPFTVNAFPLIGYDERSIYETIRTLGWKKPDDVDPNSTNCQLNSLGIVKHLERYHFHPYDYEMSMLVRLGLLSREDALKRVEDPAARASQLARQVERRLVS